MNISKFDKWLGSLPWLRIGKWKFGPSYWTSRKGIPIWENHHYSDGERLLSFRIPFTRYCLGARKDEEQE